MTDQAVDFYRQFAPCAYLELGFSERLLPDRSTIYAPPVHDFGFFGLRTLHRETIIAELNKVVDVVWPDHLASTENVVKFIGTTKIGLNFRQSELWPTPHPPGSVAF